jgi:hypothetical protein
VTLLLVVQGLLNVAGARMSADQGTRSAVHLLRRSAMLLTMAEVGALLALARETG